MAFSAVPKFTFPGDFRFALRSLGRNPGFAAAAILSLGLGIGANTAIFTLADQVMLRTLPVPEPQRLVQFDRIGDFIGGRSMCSTADEVYHFAYPSYQDLRDGNPGSLAGIAARRQEFVDIADQGVADRAFAELVSGNYFEVLGVTAAIGRTLTPADDRVKNGEPYVVLSHAYWQRRFGGDPSVLNRVIHLNGHPMTVVGVARRDFHGFERVSPADLFVPMMMKRIVTPTWDDMARRDSIWLNIFGRLAPGVDLQTAQNAMATPFQASLRNDLAANPRDPWFEKHYLGNRLRLIGAAQGLAGVQTSFGRPLLVLAAMVGTLLLLACANVANLLVTRSSARRKEIAIRLALGATRWDLVRLMMTESLLVALGGGMLALFCSAWTAAPLLHLVPGQHLDIALRLTPDARVFVFTAILSLATTVIFGLLPALQACRADLVPSLKNDAGRTWLPLGRRSLGRLLVVAQVTLSLTLLVTAGLFARSLYRLWSVDTGIQTARLLQFSIAPSRHNYTPERSRQLWIELQRALSQLPGAHSASAAAITLLADNGDENTVLVEGYRARPGENLNPRWNAVLPGFFSTVGVPLIAGRDFTERDAGASPKVVIVNETFVKRFLPHQNPIGHHVGFGDPPYDTEIVGVVRDMRAENPKDKPQPFTFSPALHDFYGWFPPQMTFYLRTSGPPMSLGLAVRTAVRDLDSSLPVFGLSTVEEQIGETNSKDRVFALLAAAFAVLATVLASVGLYGVTSYAVARRRPELGIRIALGAERVSIIRLVLREVVWLTALGTAAGIPLALALGRLVESRLYEVRGSDPLAMLASVLIIAAVSLLAGYLPARCASRIDPIQVLRAE